MYIKQNLKRFPIVTSACLIVSATLVSACGQSEKSATLPTDSDASQVDSQIPADTDGAGVDDGNQSDNDADSQLDDGSSAGESSDNDSTDVADTPEGEGNSDSPNSDTNSAPDVSSDTDGANDPISSEDNGQNNIGDNNTPDAPTLDPDAPIVLEPLYNPPLTRSPSSADEPILVTGPFTVLPGFPLVRDAGGRLPEDLTGQLTVDDYFEGLAPAVIEKPDELDTAINQTPYFEGLSNRTVLAGSTLEIILKPVDPDGNVPGMYPENLPMSAEYIDNLNGTRTLRWRPLQPDVGVKEFTIVAVDAEEPQYRVRQTVLINTEMPADPSSIVNLAPGVNAVRRHTVSVNDPVVVQIKGTDPNGTVPNLEVYDAPAGSTLQIHPTEPEFSVLRFTPATPGEITMKVIARDAFNNDSTGTTDIVIDVKPASYFTREGSRLRELASARDFLIGYASLKDFYYQPDGALYSRIAGEEFNFVSTENSLKWSFLNPLPGRYRWAAADNLVRFAQDKGMVVHGHTLIWHRQLPNWIKYSDVGSRKILMREFIDRVLNRYATRVPIWDVVNEAFEEDGSYRNSVWYEAMGENYIDIAFRQARLSAPDAQLLYNEYDVAWNGPKSDAMFAMLQRLKDRGTPLTGVGFQMHIYAAFDQFDEVEANFQKAAELGLDIYITELDVSLSDGATLEQQAEVYRRVLDICLRQSRCKGFQTWGFTDQYSWRRDNEPLLLDKEYQVKPAYTAIQQRLSEN